MIFWHKRKIDHFDPNYIFLPIAANIPLLLKTGFVVQGHIFHCYYYVFDHINVAYINPSYTVNVSLRDFFIKHKKSCQP